MRSRVALSHPPCPRWGKLMDLEKLAEDYIRAEVPQLLCADGMLMPGDLEALVALLRSVAAQARREGIEEAASFVEGHYPARISGHGVAAHWEMPREMDGGKVQSEYAKALRALATEGREWKGGKA